MSVIVLELRCRFCEGALFAGSKSDGWRCLACGSEAVVLTPPYTSTPAACPPPRRARRMTRARAGTSSP